jgi:hypothetical protein
MQPLYVSATRQDTGKTTLMIGLMEALLDLGVDVGYMKPVGQRYVRFEGVNVDEDAVLAHFVFDLNDAPADTSPIAIERGFTEHYIFHPDPKPLEARILAAYERLREAHPLIAIEGTGHAGVGSCFDLCNARVAHLLGAPVILITEGGIGKAIDEAALSLHLFRKHHVEVLGVILNKVWPEKLDKIARTVAQGLENLGSRLLGAVPYREQLGYPRMQQVIEAVGGQLLCGEEAIDNVIEHTVVAAMSPQNVCPHVRPNSLVIVPGDRIDNILVTAVVCPHEACQDKPISGLVLTGGFRPHVGILSLLTMTGIPVLLCEEDTFSVASRLMEMRFKIRPQDTDKVESAKALVREAIDVQALLAALNA